MSWLSRIMAPVTKALEGAYRPGPYYLPLTGGFLSAEAGQHTNWWQMGYDVESGARSAMVHACVSAYAQTVAMCPGDHWRSTRMAAASGGRLGAGAHPAMAQRIPDHFGFPAQRGERSLSDGNAYALGLRNNRLEISDCI